MINSILIIMASAIKGMVSKNKIRYKEDGFDLDLSYISRNIIAMGFPAEKLERFYRNHIDDVVKFFETKHKNQYKIYNLCAESKRRYDTTKFQGRVESRYSFQDHNPPPFELLKPFCESVHTWLAQDKNNVAAIHCKAGKGRTGVMICAYLIHAGECEIVDETGSSVKITTADKALEYYSRHRTHDKKGVTIPSQKRYVYYYEELVKKNLEYQHLTLKLHSIRLDTIPYLNGGAFTLICEIIQLPKQKLKTYEIEVKKGSQFLIYSIPDELTFRGDIKLEFYIKNKISKEKIFQFCFNTFFVKSENEDNFQSNHSLCDSKGCSTNQCLGIKMNGHSNGQQSYNNRKSSCRKRINSGLIESKGNIGNIGKELTLVLPKNQLDKAYKDKANQKFSSDFTVRLTFTKPVQPYSRSPDCNRHFENPFCEVRDGSTDNDSENEESDDDEDDDYDASDDEVEQRGGGETTYL